MKYRIEKKSIGDIVGYEPQIETPNVIGMSNCTLWTPIAGNINFCSLGSYIGSLPKTEKEAESIITQHQENYQKTLYKSEVVKEYDFTKCKNS
jgi:hypothetical protein